MLLSESNYQQLTKQGSHLYQAFQQWRNQLDGDGALIETELKHHRATVPGWDF